MSTPALALIEAIRARVALYAFTPIRESDLQDQLAAVLAMDGLEIDREVIADRGRYDLLVRMAGASLVLELKVSGSAPAAERQAQRYALTNGIDAVAIVTTSGRLARSLSIPNGDTLGGKPFAVIQLRGAL